MFLYELGADDKRFQTLKFHDGMNILLADRTAESTSGDSRNGAGKSSFVRILRYLLGLSLDKSLKSDALAGISFWADLNLQDVPANAQNRPSPEVRVLRPVRPQTKVLISPANVCSWAWRETSNDAWRVDVGTAFGLPDNVIRPTVGQLVSQLVRTYFDDPLKTYSTERAWEYGARIGYFLGFSPEILNKAGQVKALDKNQAALRAAFKEGVVPTITLNEPQVRAQWIAARQRRDKIAKDLAGFRVDEQYAQHQSEADRLSHTIRDLNDEAMTLRQRQTDLEKAVHEERSSNSQTQVVAQVAAMYSEFGIVLPDVVAKRFDEVVEFHTSVVRNRRHFLSSELTRVTERLSAIKTQVAELGEQRARLMELLNQSMALETFHSAERELSELDAQVADLERRLQFAQNINDTQRRLRLLKADAESALSAEMAERTDQRDAAIGLFTRLGEEIYDDRAVSLLIETTNEGVFKVEPKIDGDASEGIQSVKTFLLDMVCLVMAVRARRAPRLLVHDSRLFDAMDERQMASCLNIGSRLADQVGFQYIVTANSDRLAAAEAEGFDRRDYVIDPVLTDATDSGGLFGFQFT